MKKYGAVWLAVTGLSLSKESLLKAGALGATVAIWCGFRWLRRGEGDRGRIFSFGVLLCLVGFAVIARSEGSALRGLHLFFPRAAVFLIALAVPVAAWLCWSRRLPSGSLKVAILFSMAVLIAPRTLFGTLPKSYSIFYNGPVLLSLFVIMSWFVFPKSSSAGGVRLVDILPYLAIVLALLVDVEPLYWHRYTSVALVTPRGVVYASPDKVLAYRSALEFIDQKKNEGASIMSVPEDISLYFLAGIECPTRIYQFGPGVLAPGKMTNQEIASIEQAGVRYLIWSNRTFPEYGVPVFGTDFDQVLGQYFRSHYRPVKAIGKDRGWNAVIWERSPASSDR